MTAEPVRWTTSSPRSTVTTPGSSPSSPWTTGALAIDPEAAVPAHPHVTLLDRGLTPHLLGRAVEVLARRPHRTWSIIVGSVAIGCRAHVTEAADRELPLGRTDPAAPSLGRACRGPTPEAPA